MQPNSDGEFRSFNVITEYDESRRNFGDKPIF